MSKIGNYVAELQELTDSVMALEPFDELFAIDETRGETLAGNIAVGYVTMNRVADKRYPDTVCGVVHQAKYHGWDLVNPIKNRC